MQCEEELEVYENGFEDGRFNLRVEYYGIDARKILLAIIYELYLPDYGKEYVYPFECAKEFWGIPMEGEEVKGEEFMLGRTKFVNRSLLNRLEGALEKIEAPENLKKSILKELGKSEIYRLKDGIVALGKNFILDEGRRRLFIFNKPRARELLLRYLRKW